MGELLRRPEDEALLSDALERLPDGFIALSPDWRYLVVNPMAATLLGRTREELVGRHIWAEFPEADGTPIQRCYRTALEEQRPVVFEELYEPWGRWFEHRVFPSSYGLAVFFRDTTERRRADAQLRATTERLVEAQQIARLGSWEWVVGEDHLECSDELLRIHGLSTDQRPVTMAAFTATLHPGDRERVQEALDRAVEHSTAFDLAWRICRGGETAHVRARGRVERGPDGLARRVAGTTQDVTRSEVLEAELQATDERLQALLRDSRDLQAFAAGAAHDLAQPLATAGLLAEIIEDRASDAETRELATRLHAGLERMGGLVASLRHYAQLGGQRLVFEAVDLDSLLDEVARDLTGLLESTSGVLRRGPLPTVRGDRGLLGQLLQNLVANALTFGGDATPDVEVRADRADGAWELRVSDNGVGLAPEDAERAFQLFERLGHTGGCGSGIGLAVCELAARRHGGSIAVEPREGAGTTFVVVLPDDPAEEPAG